VFKRTRVNVQKKSNNKQTPWDASSLTGNFYFVGGESNKPETVTTKEEMNEPPAPLPEYENMIYVQGGTFQMGTNDYDNKKPIHTVTLSDFYIGKYEVTQNEYERVMGTNPSYFKCSDCPVENVSWNDAVEYARKVGKRLPTEAEWEYAARGGNKNNNYKYSGSNSLDNVAWYNDNSGSKTHSVGTKQANELGIYDMSGNVWEWCNDWYGSYSISSQSNPQGPTSGSSRVVRGGSFDYDGFNCRVGNRSLYTPVDRDGRGGFRVVQDK